MYHIALKMLLGNRSKYLVLVSGLTFATLLMTQQCAIFCGLMLWTTGSLQNMRAKIWVADPKVEQVNEVRQLRDTDVGRVRSAEGTAWAVPLLWGLQQAKLADGTFKQIQLVGLESATLVGRPYQMVAGRIEDVRLPNAVLIDELAITRLSAGRRKPIGLGDTFEINDREARVVGICRTAKSFFGMPYIFTTYDQALQFAPKTRKILSFVLAEPAEGWTAEATARAIERATGLRAYTENDFFWATIRWYFRNTGIPMSFGITILLGFAVGVAVSGQTFYTFVLENLRHLGALKAMGASDGLLARMLVLQAFTVGLIGYGLGIGLTCLFGLLVLKKGEPPFMLPYPVPLGALGVVIFICIFAALLGIRQIRKLEPAVVFRG